MNILAHQGQLEKALSKIFPGVDIQTNARREKFTNNTTNTTNTTNNTNNTNISNGNHTTGNNNIILELDAWIPQFNMVFEFQDAYHFQPAWYYHQAVDSIQLRDMVKRNTLVEKGITLVDVPCWWDARFESLLESIQFQRPELFPAPMLDFTNLISLNPPEGLFENANIPGVGVLMLASFATSSSDVFAEGDSWWLGEKYDGVRCVWHARNNVLFSRRGLAVPLPQSFADHCKLTTSFIDAELWCGRGNFSEASNIVRDTPLEWPFVRMIAFDEPSRSLSSSPFELRYTRLLSHINSSILCIIVAARLMCTSKREAGRMVASVLREGGEGIILRKPKSIYTNGRSSNLIKLKTSRGDTEALVVTVTPAVCTVQLPSGVEVSVNIPPSLTLQIGDVVTIDYKNFTQKEVPVEPQISKLRKDVKWQDVVDDYFSDRPAKKSLNDPSLEVISDNYSERPANESDSEILESRREIFDDFARRSHFDPLIPENWYSIHSIDSPEGEYVVRQYYQGNIGLALIHLYPEIDLDILGFQKLPPKYWADKINQRKLFDDFAAKSGFNPLVPEHWYTVNVSDISSEKGYSTVEAHNKGSFIRALMSIYPSIGIDPSRFKKSAGDYWTNVDNQRNFFDNVAKELGLDPLVPESWYSLEKSDLLSFKGFDTILKYYKGEFIDALVQTYPHIQLDPRKFKVNYWESAQNRRDFLLQYASKNNFDPFLPHKWYNVSINSFRNIKGVPGMFQKYYRDNFGHAITHLFPDMKFDSALYAKLHEK